MSEAEPQFFWQDMPDDELLDLRLCDLKLRLPGTWLETRINQLHHELARRNIKLKPHCWLSDEWFSPDGVPGIAVPFYLAHPRLMKLEDNQVFQVEGGSRRSCMQLLRHETGHAVDTAFRLRRRKEWRKKFGSAAVEYPEDYKPRPRSKNHVLHLDWWYSQSHPTEDFAETFAVWLQPNSRWRVRYKDWPALKKLEYVDELMGELAGKKPAVVSKERLQPLSKNRQTLREYYEEKRERHGIDVPVVYDRELKRIFGVPQNSILTPRKNSGASDKKRSAAAFLQRIRPQLRRTCARGTGEHAYAVDQMIQDMILRCRELKLEIKRSEKQEEEIKLELAVLLSVHTISYLNRGHHRVPM